MNGPGGDMRRGDRIAVRTPDRREFRGEVVEVRAGEGKVVVRLDTGWVTTYPSHMVHRLDPRK